MKALRFAEVVAYSVASVLLSCLVVMGAMVLSSHVTAQGVYIGRLQLQAEVTIHRDHDTFNYSHTDALCDTGNGTMLYIVKSGSDAVSVVVVSNGCKKSEAER